MWNEGESLVWVPLVADGKEPKILAGKTRNSPKLIILNSCEISARFHARILRKDRIKRRIYQKNNFLFQKYFSFSNFVAILHAEFAKQIFFTLKLLQNAKKNANTIFEVTIISESRIT